MWTVLAPTLLRMGTLEPAYAYAFELLITSAGVYFRIRHDGRDAAEIDAFRALVLKMCGNFGLRPYAENAVEAADAIEAAAEDRWLCEVFQVQVHRWTEIIH